MSTSGIRLVCPLCGAVASDGPEPTPGRCPRCDARYLGGGDDPPSAVSAALAALGLTGFDPGALAHALFARASDDPALARAAITSDRREGFYRWWLFVREEPDGAEAALAPLAADR